MQRPIKTARRQVPPPQEIPPPSLRQGRRFDEVRTGISELFKVCEAIQVIVSTAFHDGVPIWPDYAVAALTAACGKPKGAGRVRAAVRHRPDAGGVLSQITF
jgi:hypothetical protein